MEQKQGGSCLFGSESSADRIHSPCSETTPASAGSSSDLRCCGLACLRRDMLLASVLAMLLLLRSGMPLRFADTSAKKGSECINTLFKKKRKRTTTTTKKKEKRKKEWKKSSQTVLVAAGAERAGGQKREGRKNNVKLAGAAAAAVAVRRIAHVGIIIMTVNNASRLMAPCEGGEDWLESSGRALDMVMRDGLSN